MFGRVRSKFVEQEREDRCLFRRYRHVLKIQFEPGLAVWRQGQLQHFAQ